DLAVINKILHEDVQPPSAHAAGIPAALDRVALRALARDCATRFQTSAELAAALEEVLAGRFGASDLGALVSESKPSAANQSEQATQLAARGVVFDGVATQTADGRASRRRRKWAALGLGGVAAAGVIAFGASRFAAVPSAPSPAATGVVAPSTPATSAAAPEARPPAAAPSAPKRPTARG